MLKVKPYEQQFSGYCGPASLKMVLAFYGIKTSEKKLAKLSACTKAKGTSSQNLVKTAKKFGLTGQIKDNLEVGQLKNYVIEKKIPVIVAWFSLYGCHYDAHYSVVVGFNKNDIYLQDPEIGRLRTIELKSFKRVWFDFKGDYVKTKNDLIIRRAIILYKNKF